MGRISSRLTCVRRVASFARLFLRLGVTPTQGEKEVGEEQLRDDGVLGAVQTSSMSRPSEAFVEGGGKGVGGIERVGSTRGGRAISMRQRIEVGRLFMKPGLSEECVAALGRPGRGEMGCVEKRNGGEKG